jgi:hypothetical protein
MQISQCLIGHGAQRTQWVVLRHSLLRADIAEDIQLLFVFSAHTFFLAGCVVETKDRVFPQPASDGVAKRPFPT